MKHPERPTGAGKSSYDLLDAQRFWQTLPIEAGMTVLDLGCGQGRYSLALAKRVGPSGTVIAVDAWSDGIDHLKKEAARSNLDNIQALLADARSGLPIPERQVDMCLMATVLHDFVHDGVGSMVLSEVKRVLKPGGILGLVEFSVIDGSPGPPREMRLSIEDAAVLLQPLRLIRFSPVIELGPYLYAAYFR